LVFYTLNHQKFLALPFFSSKIQLMTQRVRKKRFHLSLVVNQTRKILLIFLGSIAIGLFIFQLFLMNNLALRGYTLSKLVEQNSQLSQQTEQLDVQLARLQTQEFVAKINTTKQMVAKNITQQYVFVSNKFTAGVDLGVPGKTQ